MASSKPQTKKASLAETHPELAAQADGWDPKVVSAGSNKRVRWLCKLGHAWDVKIVDRASYLTDCPICTNRKVLIGSNDLATTHPSIALEADGWNPRTVVAGSNRKLNWKCSRDHQWSTSPNHRTGRNQGCPYCSGNLVIVGETDLLTTHSAVASEAHGWDPKTVKAGSHKKFKWKCQHGHIWISEVANRAFGGKGCPICVNLQILIGSNDLATTHPDLAEQADGWDPKSVVSGTHKKLAWKCSFGHQWSSSVVSRAHNGVGCPICSNRKILVGYNDLATKRPDLADQAVGWDPKKVIAGAASKKRWKCSEGHEWEATVDKRMSGRGCPTCANSGFDPNEPGWMYLIESDKVDMFQIGITNNPENRLGHHARSQWAVIDIRGPMDGHLTQKLETDCLHALEKRGAILGHKAKIEKFDGYSEAWTKRSLNVTSIKQILDWVYEDEAK